MFVEPTPPGARAPEDQAAIDDVVSRGPRGAVALAGISVAIVVLVWIAFYVFVFLPRG